MRNDTRIFIYSITVVLGLVAVWFYTLVPTMAARYVWERYHVGTLALMLDRTDASLAYNIGAYYFGNQSAIGGMGARPYDLVLAERAFTKTISLAPTHTLARYMRARIEFIHSDFDAALADLNAELALYPENKKTLYMRALVYTYRGLPGDLVFAEQDFRAFVAWAPREWAGYNDLAYVLAKEKRYAEAAAVLKEGIATADGGAENPWFWNTLGVMELNMQNPSAALAAFTKAQTFAAALTDADWQRAYPGNDPVRARDGIEAMQSGIERNKAAARDALNT